MVAQASGDNCGPVCNGLIAIDRGHALFYTVGYGIIVIVVAANAGSCHIATGFKALLTGNPSSIMERICR